MKLKQNFLIQILLFFLAIYDINFVILNNFTSSRIALFIVGLLGFKAFYKIGKYDLLYIFSILIIISYSLLQYAIFQKDFTQTTRLILFLSTSYFLGLFFKEIFNDKKRVLKVCLVTTTIQAIIILIAFINPIFKLKLNELLKITANFEATSLYRSIGFTSITGASLSVIQALGIISGVNLISIINNKIIKIYISISILIILFSIICVGRTGIIISSLYVILMIIKNKKIIILIYLPILTLIIYWFFLFFLHYLDNNLDGFSVDYFTYWLSDIIKLKDNNTIDAIKAMNIPELNWDTFWGLGNISNTDGTNSSGSDIGYIQTYYSLGFLVSFLFYIFTFTYLISLNNKNRDFLGYFLIFALFFIESKEPFIFKNSFPFFIFLYLNLLK